MVQKITYSRMIYDSKRLQSTVLRILRPYHFCLSNGEFKYEFLLKFIHVAFKHRMFEDLQQNSRVPLRSKDSPFFLHAFGFRESIAGENFDFSREKPNLRNDSLRFSSLFVTPSLCNSTTSDAVEIGNLTACDYAQAKDPTLISLLPQVYSSLSIYLMERWNVDMNYVLHIYARFGSRKNSGKGRNRNFECGCFQCFETLKTKKLHSTENAHSYPVELHEFCNFFHREIKIQKNVTVTISFSSLSYFLDNQTGP